MIGLVLAATLAGPPPPPDYILQLRKQQATMDGIMADTFWLGTSGAADLFTTAWALKECPTCVEGNPLGFSVESRIALKAGGTLATVGVCYKLRRGGHHRWASIVRWSFVAVNMGLAINNSIHAVRKK